MSDIFISYSRKDSEFGRRLHTKLTEEKRDIWIDWEDIPATVEWWEKIRQGILSSDNFVLIISPHSIASPICNLEIAHARGLNKRIIPILHRATNEAQAFAELFTQPLNDFQRALLQDRDLLEIARDNWKILAGLNWINFAAETEFEEKAAELLKAVDTDIEYVDDHTRLLVRATDWEKRKLSPSLLLRGDDLSAAEVWLETAGNKNPHPAGLQREYIAESRHVQNEEERRINRLRGASVILGVAVVLAVISIIVALIQNNQVRVERELFELQVNRVTTLAAGGAVISLDDLPQQPEVFVATATAIAELTVWSPVIQQFDGVEMVQVPAGCFWMGSIITEDEQPVNEVCFNESFWIDRFEVTDEQYKDKGGKPGWLMASCDLDEDKTLSDEEWSKCARLPLQRITWPDARDFCDARDGVIDDPPGLGVRLPTEAEWEYAARGPNSLKYPWGNELFLDYVAYSGSFVDPAEVGEDHRPKGQSWVGAYDLSGNVWEWVSTVYSQSQFPYPYDPDDGREDLQQTDVPRVWRGGGESGDFADWFRVSARDGDLAYRPLYNQGFRCALSQ